MRFYIQRVICVLVVAIVPVTASGLGFTLDSRTTNSQGKKIDVEDGRGRFNRQDCLDRGTVKFTFTVSNDTGDSRELVVYSGKGCSDNPDSDDCIIIDNVINGPNSWTMAELFPLDADEDCVGEGSREIFAALVDDPNVDTVTDSQTLSVTISWDMDPPSAPTGVEAEPGDSKVNIKWNKDELEDSDVDEVIILYFHEPPSTGGDGDTDVDADSDTSAAPDGGADQEQDAGEAGGSIFVTTTEQATDDQDTGDNADDEDCPEGGFNEGDEYNPDDGYDSATSESNDGSEEVSGLTNGDNYKFGLVTADEFRNYSNISETVCATPMKTTGFWAIYSDAGGKGGKFCFVATAAFGSYDHPVVQILRGFRDEFLEPLPGGKKLINTYYQVGPGAAAIVEGNDALRSVLRGALTVFAGLTIPLSLLGPVGTMLLSGLCLALAIHRRRRRK